MNAKSKNSATKSKRLMAVNFHLVDLPDDDSVSDDVNCCLVCMFEHHGRCSVHRVKVPVNGKCDDFD